jgi:acyl carrier protein
MEETRATIRAFLGERLGTAALGDDQDLLASGLVNSLFALELVLFVEEEFAIKIENQDLERDNFKTINSLAQLIARKTALTH